MANDLSFARCLRCGATGLENRHETALCRACGASYDRSEGISLLVRDAGRHEAALAQARNINPAWYIEAQAAEAQSPWRHHLARRRRYVQAALRRELARSGRQRFPALLDLGCGDGNNLTWLRDYAGRIYGSDYNIVRLARARNLVPEAELFLADILDYPAQDKSFDAIFFNHVIEHIPDDVAALKSVHRILKPGGLLVLGTPNEGSWWWQLAYRRAPQIRATTDHVHFYTAKTIGEKMRAAGFALENTKHLGWGPPDWEWDMRLRGSKVLDDTFELLGRCLFPRQSSSLYLLARKPAEG